MTSVKKRVKSEEEGFQKKRIPFQQKKKRRG